MSSSFKIVSNVKFSYLSKLSNLDCTPNPKNRPKLLLIQHSYLKNMKWFN